MKLTQNQIDDIRHSLGWSHTPKLNKLGWRNYYYTNDPLPELDELVAKGLMVRLAPIYRVTKEGARAIGMSEKRISELGDELATRPQGEK